MSTIWRHNLLTPILDIRNAAANIKHMMKKGVLQEKKLSAMIASITKSAHLAQTELETTDPRFLNQDRHFDEKSLSGSELHSLLTEIADLCLKSVASREVKFLQRCDKNLLSGVIVRADTRALKYCLFKLLANATHHAVLKSNVALIFRVVPPHVTISISNNCAKLEFDEFRKWNYYGYSSTGRPGVGLNVVQSICQATSMSFEHRLQTLEDGTSNAHVEASILVLMVSE